MEISSSDQINGYNQEPPKRGKGGLITMPFIIANEAFEKVASYGLTPNMILYLMKDYKMGLTQGQSILFYWGAASNFLPLIGAFVSDSYLGRFLTIALGSIFSLLGMILLWLTAMISQLRPGPCNPQIETCKSTSRFQYLFLLSSFGLMSIGGAGIRPCSIAFGADQLDKRDNPKNNEKVLERFFGWYYASAALSVMIAFTIIVYIQDHLGWKIGFGIPAILMFLSASLFWLASSLYVKQKVQTSLFTSFMQVIAVAYKNRKLKLPSQDSKDMWYTLKNSALHVPSDRLRFMNKACMIQNPEDIGPDGVATNPWNICSVDQVEELKVLIRVMPLWSTSIMMAVNMAQSSFPLLQAKSMDRHLIGGLQIPAGSFGMFIITTIFIWVLLYDRVVLPLATKIRGKPVHLGVKERMGIGLFFSFLSMVVSGIVEHIRRGRAIQQGLLEKPDEVVDMSAYWLVPQHICSGLAEAFNAIAQTEFYYSEFPKTMSSIASCLFGLGMAVANLLASVILSTVDDVTKRGGKESWTSSNINRGHYESYFWLLAVLSSVNLIYFLVCSWAYGPCVQQKNGIRREAWNGSGPSEEELLKLEPQVKDDGDNADDEELSKSRVLPELLKLGPRVAMTDESKKGEELSKSVASPA